MFSLGTLINLPLGQLNQDLNCLVYSWINCLPQYKYQHALCGFRLHSTKYLQSRHAWIAYIAYMWDRNAHQSGLPACLSRPGCLPGALRLLTGPIQCNMPHHAAADGKTPRLPLDSLLLVRKPWQTANASQASAVSRATSRRPVCGVMVVASGPTLSPQVLRHFRWFLHGIREGSDGLVRQGVPCSQARQNFDIRVGGNTPYVAASPEALAHCGLGSHGPMPSTKPSPNTMS